MAGFQEAGTLLIVMAPEYSTAAGCSEGLGTLPMPREPSKSDDGSTLRPRRATRKGIVVQGSGSVRVPVGLAAHRAI